MNQPQWTPISAAQLFTEVYLTPDEFAQRFKTSKTALARERANGTGAPFVHKGKRVLYPLSLAEAHHKALTVRSTAEISGKPRYNLASLEKARAAAQTPEARQKRIASKAARRAAAAGSER